MICRAHRRHGRRQVCGWSAAGCVREEMTIVVNTGDDLEWWGLYMSPDLDSITYVLAGLLSRERGWGVKGDTFFCLQAMGDLGEPIWFHARRSRSRGSPASFEITCGRQNSFGSDGDHRGENVVKARILPMSDSRVETRVDTPCRRLSFEEYFVQRWYQDPSTRYVSPEPPKPNPRRCGRSDSLRQRRDSSRQAIRSPVSVRFLPCREFLKALNTRRDSGCD